MEIPSVMNMPQRSTNRQVFLSNTTVQLKLYDGSGSTPFTGTQYGAPQLKLSYPGDVWCIGWILLELFTHNTVLNIQDPFEDLVMVQRLCGDQIDTRRFPWAKYVIGHGQHLWPG